MILEIVSFDAPDGFDDERIVEDARSIVDHWLGHPDLLRKQMARSDGGEIVGIYTWPDENAARKAHDEAWIARFRERTGAEPRIRRYRMFMQIDNESGTVDEHPLI